jgi:rhodanese-related sulfurtransferase
MQRLKQKLQQMGSSVGVVVGTIEELRSNLGDDDANEAQNESGNGSNKDAQELQRTAEQKAQLQKLVGQLNAREEESQRRIEAYDAKQRVAEGEGGESGKGGEGGGNGGESGNGGKRKPGVTTDDEMDAFLAANDASAIIIVDVRNTDFGVEPGDERSSAVGRIAETEGSERPRALNLMYDREAKSMDLAKLDVLLDAELGKATPMITHCGGGGRGQKARLFLKAAGFTNVVNGGGPEVPELWAKFGAL